MNKPIPDDPLNHCVLLFEEVANILPRFLEEFAGRFPGAETEAADWITMPLPRPCAFGPVSWQRWQWHVLLDWAGMAPPVATVMSKAQMSERARESVERHQVCCMLFLTDAPETAQPGELDRALARAAWAMLDAGADVLIWPRSGIAWHREELVGIAPDRFDPDRSLA